MLAKGVSEAFVASCTLASYPKPAKRRYLSRMPVLTT